MEFSARARSLDESVVTLMIDALAGSGKALIYTSGVWVMGDTKGRLLGEACQLYPPAMVAWRPAVETMVLDASTRGIRSVVLRPGMVYGPNGGMIAGMYRQAKETGVIRLAGSGENHWSLIHIDDLAELYTLALAKSPAGELYVATSGVPQPVRRIAEAVAEAAGGGVRIETVPLEQATAEMGPIAECLSMDQRAGSTKAARVLGWTARKPSVYDDIFRSLRNS